MGDGYINIDESNVSSANKNQKGEELWLKNLH
jgi:hypothetical protein